MPDKFTGEPLAEMFVFETLQLLQQMEQLMLSSEKEKGFSQHTIDEVFRIMHTIKGSAAMMMLDNIARLTHTIEDTFYYLREEKPKLMDYSSLYDLVFVSVDLINIEILKLKNGDIPDGDSNSLIHSWENYLLNLKQNSRISCETSIIEDNFIELAFPSPSINMQNENRDIFVAVIHFEEGCEMENVRAFTILFKLKEIADVLLFTPQDLVDNTDSKDIIRTEGFKIQFKSNRSYEEIEDFFLQTIFLKSLELVQVNEEERNRLFFDNDLTSEPELTDQTFHAMPAKTENKLEDRDVTAALNKQTMISVSVAKLDMLMDLVGEMVIAEAMVIQNPDLNGLELSNFKKASIQLKKITNELQDIVMSIRMVSLSATFHKMNRIIRDMCRKLNKEVHLEIIGEATEVDKNIIDHISDPLMHLVRNAIDHGIEPTTERIKKGKQETGTVVLEAKNSGSDVVIIVRDDGGGLDKEKILQRAREHNLIGDTTEMTDKEIFHMILLPGFSTNENVTEYSGRGVGMDVVAKNIEAIGGYLSVESEQGRGTIFTMKIPLTLAIIDGMNIMVGKEHYTIPTISIKEFFRPEQGDIIVDIDGNEMIMIRGQCYKLIRLNELYQVTSGNTDSKEGIIIMLEQAEKAICIVADKLLGQQQVVIKALPEYINKFKTIKGLAGCTLLGDGSISLTLDVAELISL
ncbi:MAG: chemotaxis protein CheA [Herbinix sp.]|jgi:two-component system chemotaxis sensor kinase CheA|nr:chemotaxis protein CheA [Herbinix sp.]